MRKISLALSSNHSNFSKTFSLMSCIYRRKSKGPKAANNSSTADYSAGICGYSSRERGYNSK